MKNFTKSFSPYSSGNFRKNEEKRPINKFTFDQGYSSFKSRQEELVKLAKQVKEFHSLNKTEKIANPKVEVPNDIDEEEVTKMAPVENEIHETQEANQVLPPKNEEVPEFKKPERKFVHKTDEEIQESLEKSKMLNEKYKNTFNEFTSPNELFSTIINELFDSDKKDEQK